VQQMTPEPPRVDPAPSRAAYRIQRLWLTPVFRVLLRMGVPALAVFVAVGWYFSDPVRVDTIKAGLAELRASIEQRPEFRVNLMRIDRVSAEVAEDIREVTAIDFPVSSFDLDLRELRVRIEELDAVADAELVVRAGGVLEVAIRERIPALVWRGREALELLDKNGHRVSALDRRQSRADLPLITGEMADQATAEALALVDAARPISHRLRGLARIGGRRWDLVLDRDQRVMLPENEPGQALERLLALNEINDLLARDVVVIDLRDKMRPTLRLTREAVEFLHNIPETPQDGDDA